VARHVRALRTRSSAPAGLQDRQITPNDLPETIVKREAQRGIHHPAASTLAEIEKMAIVQTLHRTNWNKQEAAQISAFIVRRSTGKMNEARH